MGADGGEFWGGIHRDKQDVVGYGGCSLILLAYPAYAC